MPPTDAEILAQYVFVFVDSDDVEAAQVTLAGATVLGLDEAILTKGGIDHPADGATVVVIIREDDEDGGKRVAELSAKFRRKRVTPASLRVARPKGYRTGRTWVEHVGLFPEPGQREPSTLAIYLDGAAQDYAPHPETPGRNGTPSPNGTNHHRLNGVPVVPKQHPYSVQGGGFVASLGDLRPQEVRLSNFVARITEEIVRDDGDEQVRVLGIECILADGRHRTVEVTAAKFGEMAWVAEQLGPTAIVEAGRGTRDHLRAAIQHYSGRVVQRTIYAHTGWREIDGSWHYLHVGGAIGPDGSRPDVVVDLGDALGDYRLPDPPTGQARVAAVRASLGLLSLGRPDRPRSMAMAAGLLAYPYRAVLGRPPHSGQFTGPSGSHKTCVAALSQQHFGAAMGFHNLPASWSSTANYLERLMHAVKEGVLVIDDFVPAGSSQDVSRAQRDAERIFRSQGNGQGRQRANPDGTPQPSKAPRGSILSTGEDRVSRPSADARTYAVEFVKGNVAKGILATVDTKVLTECQRDADAGLYAGAMAAYLQWLSSRLDDVKAEHARKTLELRPLATRAGMHARQPDIVADLAAALEPFLGFAVEIGAIDQAEAERHRQDYWDGLMQAAETSMVVDDDADPADQFVRLIQAALSSNQAYLADRKTGDAPAGLEQVAGWRSEQKYAGNGQYIPVWVTGPNAPRIGWTNGTHVYLEPDASYQCVQRFAMSQGQTFPLQKKTLHGRLDDAGKLVVKDGRNLSEGRKRHTARVLIEGRQLSVLVLDAGEFWVKHEASKDGGADDPQAEEGEV